MSFNKGDVIRIRIINKFTFEGKVVHVDDFYLNAKIIEIFETLLLIRFEEAPLLGVIIYIRNTNEPSITIEDEIPTMECS